MGAAYFALSRNMRRGACRSGRQTFRSLAKYSLRVHETRGAETGSWRRGCCWRRREAGKRCGAVVRVVSLSLCCWVLCRVCKIGLGREFSLMRWGGLSYYWGMNRLPLTRSPRQNRRRSNLRAAGEFVGAFVLLALLAALYWAATWILWAAF